MLRVLLVALPLLCEGAYRPTAAPPTRRRAATSSPTLASTATVPCPYCDSGPCKYCEGKRVVPAVGIARGTAPNDEDSVGWYLRSASSQKLLDAQEEIELSQQVQRLLVWDTTADEMAERLGRAPSEEELAVELGLAGGAAEYVRKVASMRSARRLLVSSNLLLVVSVAKKRLNRGVSLQDMIQEGSVGLIKAAEKFNPRMGCRFSTYASWWIRGEIGRALAQQSRTIRLPEKVHQDISQVVKARRDLEVMLERQPTEAEVAAQLDINPEKLRALDTTRVTVATLSMNAPTSKAAGAEEPRRVEHALADPKRSNPEAACEELMMSASLRNELERLVDATCTERESQVLRMRYGLRPRDGDDATSVGEFDDALGTPLPPMQIAGQLSISPTRVRNLLHGALKKLRRTGQLQEMRSTYSDLIFS